MSEHPLLEAVIISYRCEELLRDCLGSLRDHPASGGMTVRVVDNASGDGTAEMVRREFPEVGLIVAPRNIGFGAASNLVIAGRCHPLRALPQPRHPGDAGRPGPAAGPDGRATPRSASPAVGWSYRAVGSTTPPSARSPLP